LNSKHYILRAADTYTAEFVKLAGQGAIIMHVVATVKTDGWFIPHHGLAVGTGKNILSEIKTLDQFVAS
jgi:hypothetical protein